jgi:hypothetical protein
MSAQMLEKIFGSQAKVKLMKLFLLNPDLTLETSEISKKTKINFTNLNKELKILVESEMIKKKTINKMGLNGKKSKTKKIGYVLNSEFPILSHLQNLLINSEVLHVSDLIKKINKTGKIKMIAISGIFIQLPETRLDLLIVGDEIKDKLVKKTISNLEADIGKELRYAVLSTNDYKYRFNVCDRLIRDVFEYPHEVVLDKLGV